VGDEAWVGQLLGEAVLKQGVADVACVLCLADLDCHGRMVLVAWEGEDARLATLPQLNGAGQE
jgi:hypothetical protein